MSKRKPTWDQRTRQSKLSTILYPSSLDDQDRTEIEAIARGEGKRPPASSPLIPDHQRQSCSPLGGQAAPFKVVENAPWAKGIPSKGYRYKGG
jgi:hypothetical protein